MDTITVTLRRVEGETYDDFMVRAEAAKGEVERALGLRPGRLDSNTEYARRGNTLYSRDLGNYGGKFFCALDEPKEEDAPDVLCSCGSVLFSLRYGDYEIRARCTACGTEETVYDG